MQSKSEMIVSQTGEILKDGIASCHRSSWARIFERMTFPLVRNMRPSSLADDIVPIQPITTPGIYFQNLHIGVQGLQINGDVA